MTENWRVTVYHKDWRPDIELWIWRRNPGGGSQVLTQDKNGNQIVCHVGEGESTDGLAPTLRLPHIEGQQIMKALADAIAEHGVKTDSDAKMAGTLEATRAHLSDLRQMLKLK